METDLLKTTGRWTLSVMHHGAETFETRLWVPDGQATHRARTLVAFLTGKAWPW